MTTELPPATDATLLVPEGDVADPEVSIVIPALNEALTISDFVAWCHEGLAAAGVRGEILIVDSSTDNTAELALAGGARVLKVPKKGLGAAYMDAIPYIRAPWVILGDCDCTYDFRNLAPFIERFRAGDEYVMGSRWKGSIEKGAMPPLHQYLGTPVTTWILNRLYSSRFSDIHCGMRGITRDAFQRMNLSSRSWEYASEMVIKSVHMDLRTSEVPVTFLKDRDGRLSHHKRSGWFSPWAAAWINLRAMFVYGGDFFLIKPGIAAFLTGLALMLALSGGPITVGPVRLQLYAMLAGAMLTLIGLASLLMGIVHQTLFDYTGLATRRWERLFPYNRTMAVSAALWVIGIGLCVPLVVRYLTNDYQLGEPGAIENHLAVLGITTITAAFLVFGFTLLFHAVRMVSEQGRWRAPR